MARAPINGRYFRVATRTRVRSPQETECRAKEKCSTGDSQGGSTEGTRAERARADAKRLLERGVVYQMTSLVSHDGHQEQTAGAPNDIITIRDEYGGQRGTGGHWRGIGGHWEWGQESQSFVHLPPDAHFAIRWHASQASVLISIRPLCAAVVPPRSVPHPRLATRSVAHRIQSIQNFKI